MTTENGMKVNLDAYFQVLRYAGLGKEVATLESALSKLKISETTVNQGEKGNASVFISYTPESGPRPVAAMLCLRSIREKVGRNRFGEPESRRAVAVLYDIIFEERGIARISDRGARFFMAGLFEAEEISNVFDGSYYFYASEKEKDVQSRFWGDRVLLGGILSARGCYDADEKTECRYEGLDEALVKLKRKEIHRYAQNDRNVGGIKILLLRQD